MDDQPLPPPRPLAVALVALIALLGAGSLGLLASARFQWCFAGWDVAIYDQMMWLFSFGHGSWLTVRGMHGLQHHLNLVSLALVPLYRVCPGPLTLLWVQAASIGAAALPAFALGRRVTRSDWLGLFWAAVAVSYPAAQFMGVWEFHFDPLAYPLLLTALYCAETRAWRGFALWMALALTVREPVGLCLAALGLGLALSGQRKVGLVSAALGLGWTLTAMKVIMPRLGSGAQDPFYLTFFADFGRGPLALLVAPLLHPGAFWHALLTAENARLLLNLALPLGCCFLFKPSWAVGAAPILFFNMIGKEGGLLAGLRQIHFHFHALAVPFLVGATIAGSAELTRRLQAAQVRPSTAVATPLVLVAVGLWLLPAALPKLLETPPLAGARLAGEVRSMALLHPWAPRCRALASRIGPGDSVAASHATVAQVSGRQRVYLFPELFPTERPLAFGAQPDAGTADDIRGRLAALSVDWFLVETASNHALLNAALPVLRADPRYRLVEQADGVALFRRVAPGEPQGGTAR